jgi:hypothetical protein
MQCKICGINVETNDGYCSTECKIQSEPICLRCGECCYFEIEGKRHKCKYLVKFPNGKTICKIYKTRLGTIIYKDSKYSVTCGLREEQENFIQGCPYNKLILRK